LVALDRDDANALSFSLDNVRDLLLITRCNPNGKDVGKDGGKDGVGDKQVVAPRGPFFGGFTPCVSGFGLTNSDSDFEAAQGFRYDGANGSLYLVGCPDRVVTAYEREQFDYPWSWLDSTLAPPTHPVFNEFPKFLEVLEVIILMRNRLIISNARFGMMINIDLTEVTA
jgi:hypothetical protein